ncbi:hypothetical protein KR067_004231 [Drosophila pandora]|nr:hypothetical protein KR067_004231 [Drosophila pandora]
MVTWNFLPHSVRHTLGNRNNIKNIQTQRVETVIAMSMSCPQPDMQCLRCLHCMKVICCSRYDTNGLVRHIEEDHPEIFAVAGEKIKNLHKLAAEHGVSEERLSQISKMTGLSETQMAEQVEKYMAKKKASSGTNSVTGSGDIKSDNPSQTSYKDVSSCPEPNVYPPEQVRQSRYKASIERWVPTDGFIYCPRCGCSRRPLVKASSEIGNSGCCANCIVSCWPLCFLPCLLSPDNREYLYCNNCRTFLGIYDRENNCIKPSREFVSCGKTATPPPSDKGSKKC